jgi:hypothetical protein
MESFYSLAKCFDCDKIPESPIILPCYKSVCAKHIPTHNEYMFYFYQICDNNHYVFENGYAPNKALTFYIAENIQTFAKASKLCDLLKASLADIETIEKETSNEQYIETVIDDLKSQVRMKRDELIKGVEEKSEKILLELNMCKRECVISLKSKPNERIGKFEMKKIKLENMLNEVNSLQNQPSWKEILERVELEMKIMGSIREEMNETLLMNRLSDFKKKIDLFGELKLVSVEKERFQFIFIWTF